MATNAYGEGQHTCDQQRNHQEPKAGPERVGSRGLITDQSRAEKASETGGDTVDRAGGKSCGGIT